MKKNCVYNSPYKNLCTYTCSTCAQWFFKSFKNKAKFFFPVTVQYCSSILSFFFKSTIMLKSLIQIKLHEKKKASKEIYDSFITKRTLYFRTLYFIQ